MVGILTQGMPLAEVRRTIGLHYFAHGRPHAVGSDDHAGGHLAIAGGHVVITIASDVDKTDPFADLDAAFTRVVDECSIEVETCGDGSKLAVVGQLQINHAPGW